MHPPLRRTPLTLMMRALWGQANQKNCKPSPRAERAVASAPGAHDARRMPSWGRPREKPAIPGGMAAKRERASKRGPARLGGKRGSDDAGSAALPVAPFAKAKLASYTARLSLEFTGRMHWGTERCPI